MKKNTMYILGGVAVVGLAYYLYNKNKQSTIEVTLPGFANIEGKPVTKYPPDAPSKCGQCPKGCTVGYDSSGVQYVICL